MPGAVRVKIHRHQLRPRPQGCDLDNPDLFPSRPGHKCRRQTQTACAKFGGLEGNDADSDHGFGNELPPVP